VPEEIQPEAAPVADGQGAEAEGGAAAVEASEPQYFDPTPYADQLTKVVVDGEEIEVPVAELLGGYSRTADYTRKSQQLAAQRQELQFANVIAEALAEDPQRAIEYLSQRYGLQVAPVQQEEEEFLDPLEKQVRDQGRWIEERAKMDADILLERQIAEAQQLWDDVDPREAVAYALQRGWEGRTAIQDAFAALAGQRVLAERAAQRQMSTQQQAAEQAAIAAKQRLNGSVEQGAGAGQGSTVTGPQQASTIAEAWEMAKQQLGMS